MAYITIKGFNKTAYPITTPGIYRNPTSGLISISSNGSTWYTIADKNLGATTVYNYGDSLDETNCGKYFQWGNNYSFPQGNYSNTSSSTINAQNYGPNNYYNSDVFRTVAGWDSSNNKNLRGDTTNTDVARRGPCSEGWHIPKMDEWNTINTIGQGLGAWTSSNGTGITLYLKMPFVGYKNSASAAVNVGVRAGYWTTSISSTDTLRQMIYYWNTSVSTLNQGTNRAIPIRPFKNNSVQPDSSWDVLYSGNPTSVTTPGIYWNPIDGLISLSSDGSDWITIADKNLGATTVYSEGDALSEANAGKLYQWGNNYGFPLAGTSGVSTSTSTVNAGSYGPNNYYSNSTFRKIGYTGGFPYDRDSSKNANRWGNTTNTNAARQGPCASGFHVPSANDMLKVCNIGVTLGIWDKTKGADFKRYLKIPSGGRINHSTSDDDVVGQGTHAYLWESSYNNGAYMNTVGDGSIMDLYSQTATTPSYGASIRPFANTATQPNSNRTVLYQ